MSDSPNAGSQELLRCNALRRSFGAVKAVDEISFALNSGDILGFD